MPPMSKDERNLQRSDDQGGYPVRETYEPRPRRSASTEATENAEDVSDAEVIDPVELTLLDGQKDWRLDETTVNIGRQGVRAARESLK